MEWEAPRAAGATRAQARRVSALGGGTFSLWGMAVMRWRAPQQLGSPRRKHAFSAICYTGLHEGVPGLPARVPAWQGLSRAGAGSAEQGQGAQAVLGQQMWMGGAHLHRAQHGARCAGLLTLHLPRSRGASCGRRP